jgi:hypothetical protein
MKINSNFAGAFRNSSPGDECYSGDTLAQGSYYSDSPIAVGFPSATACHLVEAFLFPEELKGQATNFVRSHLPCDRFAQLAIIIEARHRARRDVSRRSVFRKRLPGWASAKARIC